MPTAAPAAPPGPRQRTSLSLLGDRRRDPIGMFERLRRDHGDVVAFRMGPLRMFLVTDPDLVQAVLTTEAGAFRKGRILEGARAILGDGLLTSEGDHHRRQRRLVQPAFTAERIAAYAGLMAAAADRAAAGWAPGAELDAQSEMTGLTMAIVAETLFGADVASDRRRVEAALARVFRYLDLLVLPFAGLRTRLPTATVRGFRDARAELDDVVEGIIAARRASGAEAGDLLSLLLAARDADGGGGMRDAEVRDEVMTLFAAGLETTANALTFAWWLLGRHPDAEARLHREVDALAGPPGAGDLDRLPFTLAVLNEAIRLYPPAWMIARRAVRDVTLGPYRVPEGGLVMMPPYLLHRDPVRWPDAARFVPERWLPGAPGPAHRFSWLPFGGGTRKCIGAHFATMEGTLVLAAVSRRRRLVPLVPDIALQPQITLRMRGGLPCRVEPR